MVKLIAIPAALCLALGSILGYTLQKLESQPIAKQDSGEAIAATPKEKDLRPPETTKRSELLQKYALCTSSRIAPPELATMDMKLLNDLVFSVCTKAS